MAYPRVTEPDRFTPHLKVSQPKGGVLVAADWAKLRACFVAAGLNSEWADRTGRYIERSGGAITWNVTTPDTQANQLKNWGYALTKVGVHKDKASAIARTFALFGNGAGGPVIATFTVPATFKAPV